MDVLYLQRDGVLEGREEVSHGESGHGHDVIGCVSSLGGNEGPGGSWNAQCARVCAECM